LYEEVNRMKIEWVINKKRGNHRPVLKYEIKLESFEVELAVPQVVLDNAIARPPSSWRSFCYPGEDERGGASFEWYRLMTPSHTRKKVSDSLTLPWRAPGGKYEDVKVAFARLRRDFERVLANTHDSAPFEVLEHLELTVDTRNHIAAGVASARFLAAVGF